MNATVYLDHNATTELRPEALDAINASLSVVGNPSSIHAAGRQARKTLERARRQVASLVGADDQNVIFTSGGTEANTLALSGTGRRRILVSAIEHAAILKPALQAGAEIIPVDSNGIVNLESLDAMLLADDVPALVSVMLANNETGVIQPVSDIVRIARRHDALVHTDAVQAAGKIAIDMTTLGVDLMSLSAHKLGGPAGVGALVAAESISNLSAVLVGGGQERGLRAGTENLSGIAGFGAAAAASLDGLETFSGCVVFRDRMEESILEMASDVVVFGSSSPRLPNTSYLTMPGISSDTQVMSFDLAGVCVSAGSACSSGKTKTSATLKAMNIDDALGGCAIRVSLGWSSSEDDVRTFLKTWTKIYERLSANFENNLQTSETAA